MGSSTMTPNSDSIPRQSTVRLRLNIGKLNARRSSSGLPPRANRSWRRPKTSRHSTPTARQPMATAGPDSASLPSWLNP